MTTIASTLVFLALTIAIFALLGLVQKLVERLVNLANSVGLVLAILTAVFLFAALLFPERF
ncbi:potassium-transporting ATPase subunit F [Mycolicibacterium sp. PDY-3]